MGDVKEIPKHWEVKKLGEVCEKLSLNKIKIKQKDYLINGKYPVVDQGQELIGGYYNEEKLLIPYDPPYVIFGDHTRVIKFINFKFIPGADGVKVLKPHIFYNPKFFII
ncbi:MAG: restriction endonuclease subunit S [Saprospiraceae bacterium]|nr:restriction endonuclease subunit S [Saprospiraceae bacterium]